MQIECHDVFIDSGSCSRPVRGLLNLKPFHGVGSAMAKVWSGAGYGFISDTTLRAHRLKNIEGAVDEMPPLAANR
jgi:hypothetical protein